MSLPPTVRWEYNFQPKENSSESELVGILKNQKNGFKLKYMFQNKEKEDLEILIRLEKL